MRTVINMNVRGFSLEDLDEVLSNILILENLPLVEPQSAYKNVKDMHRQIEFNQRERSYEVSERGTIREQYVVLNQITYSEKDVEEIIERLR